MNKQGKCPVCGGAVAPVTAKRGGLCKECRRAQQQVARETRLKSWGRHCKWCGKPIKFTYNSDVETCSRRCQMYLMQSRRKETKEHLENRLLEYIRQQDHYVKLSELRKQFHLSDKLLYARGISCPELNFRAGKLDYLPDRTMTKEAIEDAYAEALRQDSSLTMLEVSKRIHVSVKRMVKLGIAASDIRRRYNILGSQQKTKEEVKTLVVDWLKTQPCYRNALDICSALGIDYKSSIQKKGLDVVELNALAGHSRPAISYFEDYAYKALVEAGIQVTRQKTFPGCKDKKLLRFDFWLPEFAILIEVQGAQHYNPKFYSYETLVKHDEMKVRYAAEQNIILYRIDAAPSSTFVDRMDKLIATIKGAGKVTSPVHTASNCGEPLTGNAEGNPQPSYEQGSLF